MSAKEQNLSPPAKHEATPPPTPLPAPPRFAGADLTTPSPSVVAAADDPVVTAERPAPRLLLLLVQEVVRRPRPAPLIVDEVSAVAAKVRPPHEPYRGQSGSQCRRRGGEGLRVLRWCRVRLFERWGEG